MAKITKTDIIRNIAATHGTSQETVRASIDAFLDATIGAVENGDDVAIHGFGTFKCSERAARKGHNPATGEKIDIAASKSLTFKQAKAIKDRLND